MNNQIIKVPTPYKMSPFTRKPQNRWASFKQAFTRKEAITAYLLILPGLLFYIPFHAFPILAVIWFSLTNWKGYSFASMQWAGLQNYASIIHDSIFWQALQHNLEFVFIVVVFQTVVALGLAILLEQKLPLSKFFRGVYFMPTVLSLVVVGLLFSLILSPSQGLLNNFLRTIGLNIQPAWLGDSKIALFVLMVVSMWKEFGLSMFLFIAGLETIPDDLFDAAKVDGANRWKIISNVIIPLIGETITVVVVLTTISCLKLFELVVVMTKGGPFHATEVLTTRMYNQTFAYGNVGYGSSIAFVLFLLTFGISGFNFWWRNKQEKVEY